MEAAFRHDVGRGITGGQGRAVYLGRVDRLADLFSDVSPRKYGDPIAVIRKYAPYHRSDGPGAELHGYATVKLKGAYVGANVTPTDAVAEVITEQMIKPGRDSITFQIIEWDSGEALVTADNSQIIGGVWLAFLSPAGVAEVREALGL